VTDEPPRDPDLPVFGTEEEKAADDQAIIAALTSMSPQTIDELAANTSIERAWVGLAVGRLQRTGRIKVRVEDGTEYVLLA
jgi:DNA-binding transcriptional regulator LsrR (DeoR family)